MGKRESCNFLVSSTGPPQWVTYRAGALDRNQMIISTNPKRKLSLDGLLGGPEADDQSKSRLEAAVGHAALCDHRPKTPICLWSRHSVLTASAAQAHQLQQAQPAYQRSLSRDTLFGIIPNL